MRGTNKSQYLLSATLLPIYRLFVQHYAAGIYHTPWLAKNYCPKLSHKFFLPKEPKTEQPTQSIGQSWKKLTLKNGIVLCILPKQLCSNIST